MNKLRERGFTLVEIMIVMVIIGILATIAIPNMDFVSSKNRLRSSTSEVTSSLYLARMKAVNDGVQYGVKFQEDGDFYVVKDPYGTNEIKGATNHLGDGITFSEITFVDWLAVFNEFGQLVKACLPSGDLTGSIRLIDSSVDSTQVDVTFISGRIRETNL